MSMFLRSHSRSGCTNERGAFFTCDAPADLSPVQVPAASSPFSILASVRSEPLMDDDDAVAERLICARVATRFWGP